MKKLLVVGAGGFVGGFIASIGLERGYDVTVGVRASTSRRYLTDPRLKFLVLDYADPSQVADAISAAMPGSERWDYIIYNLGATKCRRMEDFNVINHGYLATFVDALKALGKTPERLLFMSSLSAMGPQDEKNYTPIKLSDPLNPNTCYARSKIKAEEYLKASGINYIIFRATGVYGPREKDYLMMIKSIDRHIDAGMGFRPQLLTFIYVDDLVNAMFDALDVADLRNKTYIIAEPRAYTQKEFRSMVARELGRRWVLPLKLPMWAVYVVSATLEKLAAMRGKTSTLNRDKYKIMRQRNWSCDVSEAIADFGFHADFPLSRGVHETVKTYLEEKKHHRK